MAIAWQVSPGLDLSERGTILARLARYTSDVSMSPLDIFLTCEDVAGAQTYQIWTNSKANGFSLARQGELPKGTKQISFADVGKSWFTSQVSLYNISLHCFVLRLKIAMGPLT